MALLSQGVKPHFEFGGGAFRLLDQRARWSGGQDGRRYGQTIVNASATQAIGAVVHRYDGVLGFFTRTGNSVHAPNPQSIARYAHLDDEHVLAAAEQIGAAIERMLA